MSGEPLHLLSRLDLETLSAFVRQCFLPSCFWNQMLEGCWELWPSSPTWPLTPSLTAAPLRTWHPPIMQTVSNTFLNNSMIDWYWLAKLNLSLIFSALQKQHFNECVTKEKVQKVDVSILPPCRTDRKLQRLRQRESELPEGPEIKKQPSEGRSSFCSHYCTEDPAFGPGERNYKSSLETSGTKPVVQSVTFDIFIILFCVSLFWGFFSFFEALLI